MRRSYVIVGAVVAMCALLAEVWGMAAAGGALPGAALVAVAEAGWRGFQGALAWLMLGLLVALLLFLPALRERWTRSFDRRPLHRAAARLLGIDRAGALQD